MEPMRDLNCGGCYCIRHMDKETKLVTTEVSQSWKCSLCKASGVLLFHERPKTSEEMKEAIAKFSDAHKLVSPTCPANYISEESKKVGGSILSYVLLTESPSTGPTAEQILKSMPMRQQLAILRNAVNKHFQSEDDRRFYKDLILILEEFDIRLTKVDHFIMSLIGSDSQGKQMVIPS